MNNKIKNIIQQAIDIHVHIGPEIIPRKYTVEKLIQEEKGKIGGFVLKNHFYPTSPFIKEQKNLNGLQLFGGIVLNNAIGGLNSEAIYASRLLSKNALMVWLPTIHSENFLKQSMYEIAPEWVKRKNFIARKAITIKPVRIISKGKLNKKIITVLATMKQFNVVLATGHLSWKESVLLIEKANSLGITKIVITHPIYQRIAMPITIQKQLAQKGCFIEQSYSMYSIDNISIKRITRQIRIVGYQFVILSSDVGQQFSPSPSKALYNFAEMLYHEGISYNELFTMLVRNPKKLLSIDNKI